MALYPPLRQDQADVVLHFVDVLDGMQRGELDDEKMGIAMRALGYAWGHGWISKLSYDSSSPTRASQGFRFTLSPAGERALETFRRRTGGARGRSDAGAGQ